MIFKSKKKEVDNAIIDGLSFVPTFYDNSWNRIYTLLLKGMILYFVSAGLIGGALSATLTQFNEIIFNGIIITLSFVVCIFYYNKLSSNIGVVLYFFMLLVTGFGFRLYINTGFYSWMNDVIGSASVYFDLDEIGGYATKTTNTITSMTIAACFIGAIVIIIVNLSIVRKMHFLDLVLDIIMIMFLPAYLELEPSPYYSTILIIGIVMSIIWSMTGRFEKIDNQLIYSKEKKDIYYNYSPKAVLFSFAQIIAIAILCLIIIFNVLSKDNYSIIRTKSKMKSRTDEYVQILITSGLGGFFNQYENKGGISSGRLGGVGSIRLDYKTDIEVTYVPYDFSPVYLRTFIGSDYVPYANKWLAAPGETVSNDEYEALSYMYNNSIADCGKGLLRINNVDGEYGEYYAYYSDRHAGIRRGETFESEYFPQFYNNRNRLGALKHEDRSQWLAVPNDNRPAIAKFINDLGLTADMDELEVADVIKDYYFDNIPYTLRPGATPWRRDFVNFFLEKNRRGYCVHFASAATLVFREMGIPARYVEGYAFDYNDVLNGEILRDLNVEDFYSGYSKIDKLAVVKVDVLDANAHAWVEIYTDRFGWIPVELTPPSSDTDMDRSSFFDRFFDMFNSTTRQSRVDVNEEQQEFDSTRVIIFLRILFVLIVVLPIAIAIYLLVRCIVIYLKADINTKLTYRYRLFLFINKKNHPEEERKLNYNDAIMYICGDYASKDELEQIIFILEKAGFSNTDISEDEFTKAVSILKKRYK